MKIYCVGCKEKINAVLLTGKEIYPHRKDLYGKKFYQCPKCLNYVGCHPNTTTPLGFIPTKELKQARIAVHNKMDMLWKNGKISRKDLYKKISDYMGYEYHNARTTSVDECKKALSAVQKIEETL